MTAAAQGAYAQLLSLGLLWTSCHCAGMCGPLLCGMDLAGPRLGRGALRVLAYQAGKALTYAWLGALCGLLGAGLRRGLQASGAVLCLGLGLAFLAGAARHFLPRPPLRIGRRRPPFWQRPAALLGGLISSRHPLRPLLLGVTLGFLPCMIPLWALGLAALSGSPLHGAALMLLLVAMTTPVLLGATLLPRALAVPLRRLGPRLPALLPGLSGAWLLLVGAAGLGLLPHAHLGLTVAGRGLVLMFF